MKPAIPSRPALQASSAHAADTPAPLHARSLVTEVPLNAKRIMFAPAGTNTIYCGFGDNATAEVTVKVDRETTGVLNAALAALNAQYKPRRAMLDEHHEHRDSMGDPIRFEWQDAPAPAPYLVFEPSSAGAEKISGRVLRAFSGSFFTDAELPKKRSAVRAGQHYTIPPGKRGSPQNPARITGLDFPFIGTLTNDPAFKQNLPIAAKDRSGAPTGARPPVSQNEEPKPKTKMKLTAEQKAALQAKKSQLEQNIPVLKAKDQTDAANAKDLQDAETELQAVDAQLDAHTLRERNEQLEAAVVQQREKDADAAVQAAVKRGALPARNTELQATWKQKCADDPSNIVLLAAIPGSPALSGNRLTLPSMKIARESSLDVLNAFAAERDPKRRAALYAKEIKPRYNEGDDMPLHAANSVGALAGTLVTQRTLELLKLTFPALSRVSTDFSDLPVQFNQTVKSRIITIPDVQDYDPTNGWPDSDATMTDVDVTIDKHRGVPITFNAQVLASTVRRLFDEIAPAQAYALAKDMVDSIYGLITAINFTQTPTTVTPIANFGRPTAIDMGVALGVRGVPIGSQNRTLLLNAPYYGQLSKDHDIVTLAAFQKPEIITSGVLPDVDGFYVVNAPNLPDTVAAPPVNQQPQTVQLRGFGFSKSALVIATRLDNDYSQVLPGASYGNVTTVTDPDLGISVLQVQYVNHKLASATQRISLLYGVAKGQDKAGQLLLEQ